MRTTKINLLAALLIVFSLAMVSCESGGSEEKANTPAEAAEGFLKAMTTGDIDGAKAHATQASTQELDMMADMGESWEGASYEVGEVTEDNGSATATVTIDGDNRNLNLVEDEGQWKVEFEFLMPGEEPMDEEMMDEVESEMDDEGTEGEEEGEDEATKEDKKDSKDTKPSIDRGDEEEKVEQKEPTMQEESGPGGSL